MLENVDIVDISIAAVGVAMLPLLPDLLANLMVAFLPNAWVTARVRSFSSSVRRVTNTVVSRVLVVGSLVIPVLALYFQLPMLEFKGVRALSRGWWIEVGSVVALFFAVETLYLMTIFFTPGFVRREAAAAQQQASVGAGPDGERVAEKGLCKKCNIVKPPRAHHCSICRRCVLRMDHHCPFTNCCVGLRNERFFFLWLAGVWAGCLYGVSVSWPPFRLCIMQGMMRGVETLSNSDITRCVVMGKTSFIFLPAISVFLFMCILAGWHLFLILTNQTTIEVWRYRLGPLLGDKSIKAEDRDEAVSYSKGWTANIGEVLFPRTNVAFD
jgi:hypothetical protein